MKTKIIAKNISSTIYIAGPHISCISAFKKTVDCQCNIIFTCTKMNKFKID